MWLVPSGRGSKSTALAGAAISLWFGLPHANFSDALGQPAQDCQPHTAPGRLYCLDLTFREGHCPGTAELPPGITGVFVWHGKEKKLQAGVNRVDLGR